MFPWTFDWEFIFKISRKPFFSRSTSFSFVRKVISLQLLSKFFHFSGWEKCLIFQVYDDLYKPYTCLTVCVYLNDCPCLLVFWMSDDCLAIWLTVCIFSVWLAPIGDWLCDRVCLISWVNRKRQGCCICARSLADFSPACVSGGLIFPKKTLVSNEA